MRLSLTLAAAATAAAGLALAGSPAALAAPAEPAAASQSYPVVSVFRNPHFSGYTTTFYGNDDQCVWVGNDWNDKILSARAKYAETVELWEHSNCTGYAIVLDTEGYGNIGGWVSAFRARG